MSQRFRFAGLSFTAAAMHNIEESGVSAGEVERDVRAYAADRESHASLLRRYSAGADADRMQGWRDFVDAVTVAAIRRATNRYAVP